MAISTQNLPFVAFTIPEILRFKVYYRKSLFIEYGLVKCMENWLERVWILCWKAFRDRSYRIGTFSIGL